MLVVRFRFWIENGFAGQNCCLPWKGSHMFSEQFHGYFLKPQSAGRKLKCHHKPLFSPHTIVYVSKKRSLFKIDERKAFTCLSEKCPS